MMMTGCNSILFFTTQRLHQSKLLPMSIAIATTTITRQKNRATGQTQPSGQHYSHFHLASVNNKNYSTTAASAHPTSRSVSDDSRCGVTTLRNSSNDDTTGTLASFSIVTAAATTTCINHHLAISSNQPLFCYGSTRHCYHDGATKPNVSNGLSAVSGLTLPH
jgi:hypothetical protein